MTTDLYHSPQKPTQAPTQSTASVPKSTHQKAEPYLSSETLYFVAEKIVPTQKALLKARIKAQSKLLADQDHASASTPSQKPPSGTYELLSLILDDDPAIARLAFGCYAQLFWHRAMATGKELSDDVRAKLLVSFGSVEKFVIECQRAVAWDTKFVCVFYHNNRVKIIGDALCDDVTGSASARTLFAEGAIPVLIINLNESAYYLDYRDRRDDYVRDFLAALIDWDFVREQMFAPKPLALGLN